MRRDAIEQGHDAFSVGCIPAQHAMPAEDPEVARSADRLLRRLRAILLTRVAIAVSHEVVDLAEREAETGDVDAQVSEIAYLEREEVHVPAGAFSELVVGEDQ